MNFSTHQPQIVDLIKVTLTKDKNDWIERFKIILNKFSNLSKSERFDFWLNQLGTIIRTR